MIIKGAVRPGGFAEENHQAFAALIPACHFVEMDNLGKGNPRHASA